MPSPADLSLQNRPAWPELARARDAVLTWFRDQAMPWWTRQGTDWLQGGFEERFTQAGLAISEPRRTRVTARQVYVASVATELGWAGDSRAWLDHGLRQLQGRLRLPSGIYAASVTPDGQTVHDAFDLYEQAFALFAMACAARHTAPPADQSLKTLAQHTLTALRQGCGHPLGGFHDNLGRTGLLRANPHMHMLEASLAWECHNHHDPTWGQLSDEIVGLAMSRFMCNPAGALTEYFDDLWQPLSGARGQVVEPGHQFEWGWLLLRWGSARQAPEALRAAHHLIELAEQHGVCPVRGVAFNEIDTRMSVTDGTAKLWPQTERVKAWCQVATQAASLTELDRALAHVIKALNGLTLYLRHPIAGLWQEVMQKDGAFTEEPCRASSFYHIVCALDALNSLR